MRHMGGTPGIKPEPAVPQTAVLSLHHGPHINVGVRGGTRTRKTRILSAVRMPVPTPGDLVPLHREMRCSDTGRFGVPTRIRTERKTALDRLCMPFRHKDMLVGVEGVEPSPRGPRPRILPLYDTPMMKQAVFLLSGGLYKTTCFNCGS